MARPAKVGAVTSQRQVVCDVTALGERRLLPVRRLVHAWHDRSVATWWRRPSRPGWLFAAVFWLAFLVLGAALGNWLSILVGCSQLALAIGMAWNARWTQWTPNWWPRRRKDGQEG